MRHELPPLPYSYDALEPHIDARTMEIHHLKHHAAYVNKLNEVLANYPGLREKSVEDLILSLDSIPEAIRTAVRNAGGGHYNHSLFWRVMKPVQGSDGREPRGKLNELIKQTFGGFENFRNEFSQVALNLFGSGWAWLVINAGGQLAITYTQNQDSPVSKSFRPLLCLDVWEHAYYLKYQNRRNEYIEAWWHLANWEIVENWLL